MNWPFSSDRSDSSERSRTPSPVGPALHRVESPRRRLPILMYLLAALCLLWGLRSAGQAINTVQRTVLMPRDVWIESVRTQVVEVFSQGKKTDVWPSAKLKPLLKLMAQLPDAEIERLARALGAALYDRREIDKPLAVLQLLLSMLLMHGVLVTWRREPGAVSTWIWACRINMPFSLLSMLVTFMHSRALMSQLGSTLTSAISPLSGRPPDVELNALWQLTRVLLLDQGQREGVVVLLLGLIALYLQGKEALTPPVVESPASDGRRA